MDGPPLGSGLDAWGDAGVEASPGPTLETGLRGLPSPGREWVAGPLAPGISKR